MEFVIDESHSVYDKLLQNSNLKSNILREEFIMYVLESYRPHNDIIVNKVKDFHIRELINNVKTNNHSLLHYNVQRFIDSGLDAVISDLIKIAIENIVIQIGTIHNITEIDSTLFNIASIDDLIIKIVNNDKSIIDINKLRDLIEDEVYDQLTVHDDTAKLLTYLVTESIKYLNVSVFKDIIPITYDIVIPYRWTIDIDNRHDRLLMLAIRSKK